MANNAFAVMHNPHYIQMHQLSGFVMILYYQYPDSFLKIYLNEHS